MIGSASASATVASAAAWAPTAAPALDAMAAIGSGGSFSTSLSVGLHTVTAEVTDSGGLSDAQAKTMLTEALAVDEGRLKLRRDFMERMGKVIPPRKLVRFFQIENKLDSVVRADISKQIPLAP